MQIEFYKYQGTGNDFVIIDNRSLEFPKDDTALINKLCDRRFGVGADGLMLLENHVDLDFIMVYYNSDGNLSSMCGNGGRCLVHFAKFLGIISSETVFEAIDGLHHAKIDGDEVELQMGDVAHISEEENFTFLDTGSPHHVAVVDDVDTYPVVKHGRQIRNETYGKEGANVNFVSKIGGDLFKVRTYERGVEDETLSCGTGVTAVALAMHRSGYSTATEIGLITPGGNLKVCFSKTAMGYEDIWLKGPAVQVYKGIWK